MPLSAIRVLGPMEPGFDSILTPEALQFVAALERCFRARRARLLQRRDIVQRGFYAAIALSYGDKACLSGS